MSRHDQTQDASGGHGDARMAPSVPAVNPLAATIAASDSVLAPNAVQPFPVVDWDRYTFVRVLGQGGMGTVYEALDKRLERRVALKFIRGGDHELAMRFLREARAQARIEHENVCKVFEVGEVENKAYIAMQYVVGDTLDKAAVFMTLDEKIIVMRDVAHALHAAHTLGILHRDIKPSNILVEKLPDGRYKPIVMDFGLAREESENRGMTETGMVLGTPAYMSPEQASGIRGIDRRTDIYSLGATLYEVLSGQAPFIGESPMHIIVAVLSEEPKTLRSVAPSIPVDLATITSKCLRKEPTDRYESARALAEDLDRYLRGETILGRREGFFRQLRRWAGRHRAIVAMTLISLMLLGGAIGIVMDGRLRAARERADLEAQANIEREIGQDIEQIEWLLRTAYILPKHDITQERSMVKERLKVLEARGKVGGHVGALVEYAMGRGHWALGEDEKAYQHLMLAKKRGLDSPDLHYALGLALGRRYERALRAAQRGDGLEPKEIEEQYLRPTLESMEKSRGAQFKSQKYLDALLAYYKKNYDTALQRAHEARKELPWLYEALELEAGIYLTRGIEESQRGDFDVAAKTLEEAVIRFDMAIQYGRSDARLYEAGAEARLWILTLATSNDAAEVLLKDISKKAEDAQAIDPSRVGPTVILLDAYRRKIERSISAQSNRDIEVEEAAKIGERALATLGKIPVLCDRMCSTYNAYGVELRRRGLDAEGVFKKYVEVARCAWDAGSEGGSLDALGWAPASKQHRDQSLATVLDAYSQLGANVVWHGKDPRPLLQPGVDFAAERLRIDPRNPMILRYAGRLELWNAEYLVRSGQDARKPLEKALQFFDAAATKVTAIALNDLSAGHLLKIDELTSRGEDPQSELDIVAKLLVQCDELRATNGPVDLTCGQDQVHYRVLAAQTKSPPDKVRLLREAIAAAHRAIEDQEHFQGTGDNIGQVQEWLLEATYQLAVAEPKDMRKLQNVALEAARHVLAINPHHPGVLKSQGKWHILEAEEATGLAKKTSAQQALDAFEKAKGVNPLLEKELKPLVERAKQLVATSDAAH